MKTNNEMNDEINEINDETIKNDLYNESAKKLDEDKTNTTTAASITPTILYSKTPKWLFVTFKIR